MNLTPSERAWLKVALRDGIGGEPLSAEARSRAMRALGLHDGAQVTLRRTEQREIARSLHHGDKLYTAIWNGDHPGGVPAVRRATCLTYKSVLRETRMRFAPFVLPFVAPRPRAAHRRMARAVAATGGGDPGGDAEGDPDVFRLVPPRSAAA